MNARKLVNLAVIASLLLVPLVSAQLAQAAPASTRQLTSSDDHSVYLFQPSVVVDKTGNALAKIGDTVTYAFRVTNTSSIDTPSLILDSITDTLLGDLANEALPDCDQLAPNAFCTFTVNRIVQAGDPDPLTNTVTVHYHPDGFGDDITASDGHSINLFRPAVQVVKSGPTSAKVGDSVAYTFRVTNTSSSDTPNLVLDSITDTLLGNLADEAPAACDQLAPNAFCTFTVNRVVQAGDADPLPNTVTVHYQPLGFGHDVTDSDNHSLGIDFKPVLRVVKSGPSQAQVGTTVTYSFLVFHAPSSDRSPVSQVALSDSLLGPVASPSGDGNGNNVLDAGEIWEYSATYVVKPTDPDLLTNTATVSGRDRDNESVSATATHTVTIEFNPALAITKSGPATAVRGQKVTYTFAVSHSGGDGSPVDDVVVNDNVTGPAIYTGGDDGDGRLEPGETWNYTATYTIPSAAPNPLVNSAGVTASDKDGDDVTASDSHSLDVRKRLVYMPVIVKPSPTILAVHNDHTGGNVTVIVRELGTNAEVTRCTVPNNATLPCDHDGDGSNVFPSGTYSVYVASVCGTATVVKTYASGPQTTRVYCQ
jgi:uncharacterized repeat protein (TIGR01451 family)